MVGARPCAHFRRGCMAVLLNILIAVVGDSHEHATMEAQLIFLRNRIQQAAQVDAGDADSWAWRFVDCLLRPLLRPLLIVEKADSDDDSGEMWMGRALELEHRTRGIIVEEGGQTRDAVEREVGAMENRVGQRVAAMEKRVGHMENRLGHMVGQRMGELERSVNHVNQRMDQQTQQLHEQLAEITREQTQQLAEITRMLSERQACAVGTTSTPAQTEVSGDMPSRKERARRDAARNQTGRSPERARPLSPRWWARPQS